MFTTIVDSFNIYFNDIFLLLSFYMIQQTIPLVELLGYILLCVISFLEIKNQREKNRKKSKNYINTLYSITKKDYTIYNNIIESINNKEYHKIDIMKCYKDILNTLNNLDYDFDKINNCIDLLSLLTMIDNILYLNKVWGPRFIEDGQEIVDIYARLVNQIHNVSIIIKECDIDGSLLCKELDELYLKFNYNIIKRKITDFYYMYR